MKTRLHKLSARIEAHLVQFEEIALKNEGGIGCCGDYGSRGPTLYVSGRRDSKVYDLPKEGEAKIKFRLRSKGVDYDEDGTERYRTDIEVKSLEPVNFEAVVDGYEFGSAGFRRMKRAEEAITKKLKKTSNRWDTRSINKELRPLAIKQDVKHDSALGRSMKRPDFGLRYNEKLRKASDEVMGKKSELSDILARYEFGDRARDGGGRFAPGQNVSTDEMADAYLKPKKKTALLAGAGVAGVAAAAAMGSKAGIGKGVGRLMRGAM